MKRTNEFTPAPCKYVRRSQISQKSQISHTLAGGVRLSQIKKSEESQKTDNFMLKNPNKNAVFTPIIYLKKERKKDKKERVEYYKIIGNPIPYCYKQDHRVLRDTIVRIGSADIGYSYCQKALSQNTFGNSLVLYTSFPLLLLEGNLHERLKKKMLDNRFLKCYKFTLGGNK
jgi:hypothetical protein